MSKKIIIKNLPPNVKSDDLAKLFAFAGKVKSANIVEDQETGRSRGFGFVEMSSLKEAKTAIKQLNGKKVGEQNLQLKALDESPNSTLRHGIRRYVGSGAAREDVINYKIINMNAEVEAAFIHIENTRLLSSNDFNEINELKTETRRLIEAMKEWQNV